MMAQTRTDPLMYADRYPTPNKRPVGFAPWPKAKKKGKRKRGDHA